MNEAFAILLRDALGPYDELLVEQQARLQELERRIDNIIQPGRVVEIHDDGTKVRVESGQLRTPWIGWVTQAAGEIADYRCPSEGEQCLLLNYSGGENTTQCWALCGLPSERYPMPEATKGQRVTTYPDGITVLIDPDSGQVITTSPTVLMQADMLKSTGEIADKVRSMSGDRGIYDGHTHPSGCGGTGATPAKQGG